MSPAARRRACAAACTPAPTLPRAAAPPCPQVKETGARFRDTVLALGGSVAPAEVFKLFRGRGPSTRALLQHNDLLPAGAAA